MPIRKSQRRGKPCLIIDIRYTTKNGRQERFRKDARGQTVTAAKAEEERYLLNIAHLHSYLRVADGLTDAPIAKE